MAIRLKINGVEAECDSVAEAAELISALNSRHFKHSSPTNGTASHSASHHDKPLKGDFASLWKNADEVERKMLRVVTDASPEPVIAENLARQLNLKDVNAVGWVRRKLNSAADGMGVVLDRYLAPDKVLVDGRPKTAYRATDKLTEAMSTVQ